MELQIIIFYVLCHELLTALNIREDSQVRMTDAEVMTVVLTSACFFSGNFRKGAVFLNEHGYIPRMLSESRLNRRIHGIDDYIWEALFSVLSEIFKMRNNGQEYVTDSFPVPVCDNIRISRSKIFRGEDYRGYISSKKRYFFGIRVHMIITASGEPVEFLIAPGAESDVTVLKQQNFGLPPGSVCYGDKIYNDYSYEDLLKEVAGIILKPIRKKNSKRAEGDFIVRRAVSYTRKKIETVFSIVTNFFPKKIHAVTSKGFALKVMSFILVFAIQSL
ncbi:MAG: IS982 family transposase [Desulfobacterales bacterium]